MSAIKRTLTVSSNTICELEDTLLTTDIDILNTWTLKRRLLSSLIGLVSVSETGAKSIL